MKYLLFAAILALAACGGTVHGVAQDFHNDWQKVDPPKAEPKAQFHPSHPPRPAPQHPTPASGDGKVMDVH